MATQPAIFDEPEHRVTISELIAGLLEDGRVDSSKADDFLIPVRGSGPEIHPLVIISQQEWIDLKNPKKKLTLEVLTEWLAERSKLPYFRIDPLKVDVTSVTSVMSSAYASRHKILPVEVNEHSVIIATAEPYMRDWENELSHVNSLKIKRVLCNPTNITRYLTEFYSVSQSIRTATSENEDDIPGVTNFEALIELGKSGQLDTNDKSVVHIVDWLLQFAFDQRASDIHLEPRRDMSNIRFRIDGVMHTVYEMPTPVMTVVIARVKVLGRMDVVEKRRPQDGRIKSKTPKGDEIELRLSTMPTAFGEKMVMRIFDPDVLVKDFSGLGFSEKDTEGWKAMFSQPHGIVLVTGPTGSGKTTTLYSTLKLLAQPEVNVCTVEDPIEMVMSEFNQMQVQHNIGVNFASGIRTLLRQDPDIIMVGEIRDQETAEMATQAALTGHLVLSTLHTNDAAAAIPRLREIGIPAYLINATLIGIMAQRLVRTLCAACKEPTEVDQDMWKTLTQPWKMGGQGNFCKPVGCEECRYTGFKGRIGIYEMMILDKELRATIHEEIDSKTLREFAVKSGMTVMRISGARKVAMGLTTIDEVIKVVPPDEEI
ncbi:Type II secretory pathway, ATPase PulE/Tfp pilus assembly pathway, ATPase PilB [hydrothermal vent metagenome]|uniref:Type II secretory pathway, ATPase PulE/Tfp pilus assembly pathway, ATPase PilB n=1 Tax=hydrothermal vent metagenome TaxID=652676 RepID=A0A3B1ABA7_9ZZZZ